MATAGDDVTNKRESLTCALCLDIYTSPKLLPCHHTFCEQCLKDLAARHPSGTFPCPACREETTVPPGGVSAFQTNFYIDPQDLDRARDNTHCMTHLTKELEFFCIKCDQAICINCKLTEHEYHKTQDLQQAAAKAKIQLSENLARIERCVKLAKKNADDARTELQGIQDKKTELTAVIHRRRDAIVAMVTEAANKYRDEALASLNEMTDHMKIKQEKEVEITQQNLEELTKLQQRVQQAVDSGAGCELVTVAREMRCGRGSEEAVQKLTTKQMTTVCRPVLRFSATHVVTLERMRDYMGSAAKMEMAVSAPEVTVIEQFRCREDPDTDVCHVCPTTDGEVLVSYEKSMMREGATFELLTAKLLILLKLMIVQK
ncbi:hypothetical protein BaRGS_00027219 [Batillaria attramentaria]|uniref:Uncharacterized protein n=1 Tax=Batillaria attramentaria TaxID=370345 RepID=A0ABD0K3V2_9CAEN